MTSPVSSQHEAATADVHSSDGAQSQEGTDVESRESMETHSSDSTMAREPSPSPSSMAVEAESTGDQSEGTSPRQPSVEVQQRRQAMTDRFADTHSLERAKLSKDPVPDDEATVQRDMAERQEFIDKISLALARNDAGNAEDAEDAEEATIAEDADDAEDEEEE